MSVPKGKRSACYCSNCCDSYGCSSGAKGRVRIAKCVHEETEIEADILAAKTVKILEKIGATNIQTSVGAYPPQNLQAGGCRFGNNPKTSVLDKTCRAHEVPNLYVTDGSFMPTGGSVPYTWTIYANAFRVADEIQKVLA